MDGYPPVQAPLFAPLFAQALGALLPWMEEAEAHKAAAAAAPRIVDAMELFSSDYSFVQALEVVLPWMEEAEAHKAAAAAAQRILDFMDKYPDPTGFPRYAKVLAAVAALMDEAEARKTAAAAAQRILDVMAKSSHETAVSALAQALGAVLPWMEEAEAHKAAAAAAPRILDVMKTFPGGPIEPLTQALGAVLPWMEEAEAHKAAAAEAQRIFDAMAKTSDLNTLSSLARMLGMVAPRLDEAGAAAAVRRILDIMDKTSSDPNADPPMASGWQSRRASVLLNLAKALAVAAPRLGEAGASRFLNLIARNPGIPIPDDTSAAIQAVVAKLSLQGKVDLLKHPACVSQVRDVVLLESGKQLDHKFADVWNLVDWLADHHPEIDVLSPPQPPQP